MNQKHVSKYSTYGILSIVFGAIILPGDIKVLVDIVTNTMTNCSWTELLPLGAIVL